MTFARMNADILAARLERKKELEGIFGREISNYEFKKIEGELI